MGGYLSAATGESPLLGERQAELDVISNVIVKIYNRGEAGFKLSKRSGEY